MDKEGFFNIYINTRLNYSQQQKAIRHEMTHATRGDFFKEDVLENIETM